MIRIAGSLFFLAGACILMGIITAEIFYPPGYSISLNMISNLGSTPPPLGIIKQPSATIFDTSMLVSGLLIVIGAYLLQKKEKGFIGIAAGLMGLGACGVGIFPAFHAVVHPLVALLTFLAGGIAAVLSFRIIGGPFRYLAVILGAIALLFLALGILLPSLIVPIMGRGGTERWIAYPIVLWLTGFGGYLMNTSSPKR